MVEVFRYIDRFFASMANYLTYNDVFLIFVGLFLVALIFVVIFTANSYEAKLIKAIDKFNYYFIDTPYLNEDNLVAFNQKMKTKQVPKQLRKHWQQFVLYREKKASEYMSFDNCVANPIKNSSYTRDTKMLGILAWIFSLCALILNCYYCFDIEASAVLRSVLLTPILILLINYFAQIFLSLRHNAIVSDLFQNYQYFQVNIDKATETLPEYVDYEVLFDRNEIKKGIPILYAYLQKRAEEEKRELERARLRNVEHERFNFDDQGVAGSLVLERAMHEAENYIAERKKYTQDIGQINADMTQEDMNYREITKEYNRQMQVSKETFENFKAQLEEASSSIEANYLKKQQQQELDRQRNLERDFDAATDRHKKIIDSFHKELDAIDKFIAQSRQTLENAMKSEFETYSGKVYDEARKLVDEREKEKYAKLQETIHNLEENLAARKKELEELYQANQTMSEQLEDYAAMNDNKKKKSSHKEEMPVPEKPVYEPIQPGFDLEERIYDSNASYEPVKQYEPVQQTEVAPVNQVADYGYSNEEVVTNVQPQEVEEYPTMSYADYMKSIQGDTKKVSYDESVAETSKEEISTNNTDDSINQPVARRGRPRKEVTEVEVKEKKKPGRPRKIQDEIDDEVKEKRKPGRPRKEVDEKVEKPKGKVGRPKKAKTNEEIVTKKKGRGRPRKVQEVSNEQELAEPKKGRGRPRKNVETNVETKVDEEEIILSDIKDIDEYLKEIDDAIAVENAKLEETQKELVKNTKLKRRKK